MEVWMFNPPRKKEQLKQLVDAGVRRVVCTYDFTEPFAELGIQTYTMIHTFRQTENPKEPAVDIYGNPMEWFNSGCPNSPRIRQQFYVEMERLLSQPVQGVFLDGVRFSSPASSAAPTSFFTCFCHTCQQDMIRRGFDLQMIMSDVAKVAHLFCHERQQAQRWLSALRSPSGWISFCNRFPGFASWLNYRIACISDFVAEVRHWINVHHPKQKLGGFLFQPALSALVGQDYPALSHSLHIISPMIYRNYPSAPGPAAINQEILSMAKHLGKNTLILKKKIQLMEDLLAIFGIAGKQTPLLSIPSRHVLSEVLAAQALSEDTKRVIPIIWAGDAKLNDVLNELADAGIPACILFTYDTGLAAHGSEFFSMIANRH